MPDPEPSAAEDVPSEPPMPNTNFSQGRILEGPSKTKVGSTVKRTA